MEIFQIPSGATKLSLTQSQSSNNLIRKLLLDSAITRSKWMVESNQRVYFQSFGPSTFIPLETPLWNLQFLPFGPPTLSPLNPPV